MKTAKVFWCNYVDAAVDDVLLKSRRDVMCAYSVDSIMSKHIGKDDVWFMVVMYYKI